MKTKKDSNDPVLMREYIDGLEGIIARYAEENKYLNTEADRADQLSFVSYYGMIAHRMTAGELADTVNMLEAAYGNLDAAIGAIDKFEADIETIKAELKNRKERQSKGNKKGVENKALKRKDIESFQPEFFEKARGFLKGGDNIRDMNAAEACGAARKKILDEVCEKFGYQIGKTLAFDIFPAYKKWPESEKIEPS